MDTALDNDLEDLAQALHHNLLAFGAHLVLHAGNPGSRVRSTGRASADSLLRVASRLLWLLLENKNKGILGSVARCTALLLNQEAYCGDPLEFLKYARVCCSRCFDRGGGLLRVRTVVYVAFLRKS